MDYPQWLCPSVLGEIRGTPREPHVIYDDLDDEGRAQLERLRSKYGTKRRNEPANT